MKRLFTLTVLLSLASLTVFASKLNIRMHDYSNFAVILNGQEYTSHSNEITINAVAPGRHHVEIVQFQRSRKGRFFKNTVYSGSIVIPRNMMVYCILNQNLRLRIVDEAPIRLNNSNARGYYGTYNTSYNTRGSGRAYNGYYDRTRTTYNRHDNRVMLHRQFEDLRFAVRSARFESSKADIVRNALRRNLFTSAQVLELLDMFTFESTKLDLAKVAYRSTVDPQRFRVVYRTFTFDSSIRELERFIYRN